MQITTRRTAPTLPEGWRKRNEPPIPGMTASEWRGVLSEARFRSKLSDSRLDAGDLAQGALVTFLERGGNVPVPPSMFLRKLVKQRACTFARHKASFPDAEAVELEEIEDTHSSLNAHDLLVLNAAVRWLVSELEIRGDEEGLVIVRTILEGAEALTGEHIMAATGMSKARVQAVSMRLRGLAKSMPEGLLRDVAEVLETNEAELLEARRGLRRPRIRSKRGASSKGPGVPSRSSSKREASR